MIWNWNNFIIMFYNLSDDKFSTAKDFVHEMANPIVYCYNCELVATGNIFPFLFEIYHNNNL